MKIPFSKVITPLLLGTSLLSAYTIPGSVQGELQEVIDSFMLTRPDIKSGISVSIKTEKDQWSYARGAARIDTPDEQIDTETPFLIFSITKTMVSAYALDLVRRGDLRLKDTIGSYYDFESENPSISNAITIEQLLNHRAGLGQFAPYRPTGLWNPHDFIELIPAPLFEPGKSHAYSGSNTVILSLIIQMVTGEDLNVLLKRRFFDRHRITGALIPQDPVPENVAALNAPLYHLDSTLSKEIIVFSDVIPFEKYGGTVWCEGGLIAKPKDVAKFGYDLLSGNDNGFRWIGQKMINSIDPRNAFPKWNWQMGYGIATFPQITEENYGFQGYGWGTSSSMYYLPSSRSCISVFVNQTDAEHSTYQHKVQFPLTNRLNEILVNYLEEKGEKRSDARFNALSTTGVLK